ncbi:MAG: RrF2 family transcriptional regulator [Candidatus Limnocylindrales bacterium]
MRLEITRKTDLALRALRLLSADRTPWKGAQLAEAIGTTPGFLAQALGPLVRRGWIGSTVGPSGGYRWAGATSELSLLDVIEAIEGPVLDANCILPGSARCSAAASGKPCTLHDGWVQASAAVLAMLAGTPASAPCSQRPPGAAAAGPASRSLGHGAFAGTMKR